MISLYKDLTKLQPLLSESDKWKFVLIFGLMLGASFLEAVGVGVIPLFVTVLMKPSALSEMRWVGQWFTELPESPSLQVILWASLILILFIILKSIFLMFVYYIRARIINGYRVRLCDRMFCAYQSAPYEWHLQHSSAELLRNIQNDTNQILSGVITPFLDILMGLTMGAFIIAMMLFSTPASTITGLAMMGIALFFVIRLFQKKLHTIGEVMRHEAKGMIQAIQQGFGALIDARILGCEAYLADIFRTSIRSQAQVLCERSVIERATSLLVESILVIGLIVILLVLIQVASSLEEALPVVSLLGVATIRLKQMVTQVAAAINKINSSRAYIPGIVNDVMELEELEQQQQDKQNPEQQLGQFDVLELNGVSYSYINTDVPAINNISLELRRGESIAFVGSTGCGKSTLVNLILGLLEPQFGHITVNGKDIFSTINEWRAHLGYISQTIFLVDDTLRANVAFGIPVKEVCEEKLWNALYSARLDDFVRTLPNGLETVVGERGVRLSGGQRQRLGIARALYFDPEVLVMDEATSALDNKTESEVMEAIQNLKADRTIIMIAHRLSTVENCDRIYYLHDGQIEGCGTYSELRKSVNGFAEMTNGSTVNRRLKPQSKEEILQDA